MELIGRNDELLNIHPRLMPILDGELQRLNIYHQDYVLYVELDIKMRHKKGEKCRIRFIGVSEYSFYYHNTSLGYNIERYKLLKAGDSFYISLDPYDEDLNVDERDQDFILSSGIEGYFIA